MKLDYVAVEGPIGVGKTTLAMRLAEDLDAELLVEAPDEVPFLEAFYAEPEKQALQTQLCFLLQRARQIDELRQQDLFRGRRVADFLFDKDRLFAELNLSGAELELYREIFRRLAWEAPVPDRVVYLQAPVPLLQERIRRRGRPQEQGMQDEYLEAVCTAYNTFFQSYRDAPVIWVDASQYDLVHDQDDYRKLLDALTTPGSSRALAGRGDAGLAVS